MFLEGLAYRLAQTTPNARRLLAVLVVVFIPMLLVSSVILPLFEARRAAEDAVAEAEALYRWVHSQAAQLPASAFSEISTVTEAQDPAGIGRLEDSLAEAGIRDKVNRLSNRRNGEIDMAFDAVAFDALIQWLEATSTGWGYDIARLTIERGEISGQVSGSLHLVPVKTP